jgi:tRNA(fMet)-specific endonuclease VapC
LIRRYMLDTNMVGYIAKGRSLTARTRLRSLSPFEIACISSITEGEIRYGIARQPEAYNRHSALLLLMASLPVLPWNGREAKAYGILRAEQNAMGKPLATMDLLIAAHALAASCTLVTRDSVFQQVPRIRRVENWATDV